MRGTCYINLIGNGSGVLYTRTVEVPIYRSTFR
jgi:hypothetical protein